MKRLVVILLMVFIATSWTYKPHTFNPEYDLYSAADFDRHYSVTTFGYPYGLCFVVIQDKYTGMYAFGRGFKYRAETGEWRHVLKQRTEFVYSDVGLYKPYPIPAPDDTPHFLFPVKENDKWGFVDLGEYGWAPIMRIPCIYDEVENTPFVHDAYAEVMKNDKWIVIDQHNNEVKI